MAETEYRHILVQRPPPKQTSKCHGTGTGPYEKGTVLRQRALRTSSSQHVRRQQEMDPASETRAWDPDRHKNVLMPKIAETPSRTRSHRVTPATCMFLGSFAGCSGNQRPFFFPALRVRRKLSDPRIPL